MRKNIHFHMTLKVLGVLLIAFSLSMLIPVLVSIHYRNGNHIPFYLAFSITFLTGFSIWLPTRHCKEQLRTQDGFVIVTLMWIFLATFGSLPFILSDKPHTTLSVAFFETMSGLTTTGMSALSEIDTLSETILYYRQQLQFLGGMGIIVLGVAILPLIGVGGIQLYKAESSKPLEEEKFTPRIAKTAKALWISYASLTLLCILSFWLCGMELFEAICYAFGTISTGGYAPHGSSIAYYNSPLLYIVTMLFMILGGINFSLHYLIMTKASFQPYLKNQELRIFLFLMLILGAITSATLYYHGKYPFLGSLIHGYFQVISVGTSTGFISDPHYTTWPTFLPILLMMIGLLGACAGSTSGGIKVIRLIIMQKHIAREIKRLLHPRGIFAIKIGSQVLTEEIVSSVWAFIGAYIALFVLFWIILLALNLEPITAFSLVISCLANGGAALGDAAFNCAHLPATALWILSLAMLCGRLEIFTVLVLCSRQFWRD